MSQHKKRSHRRQESQDDDASRNKVRTPRSNRKRTKTNVSANEDAEQGKKNKNNNNTDNHNPSSPKQIEESDNTKDQITEELDDHDIAISEAFMSEYYDIVDQLPLEIRRNCILLRELDDQQMQYTTSLRDRLFDYMNVLQNKLVSHNDQQQQQQYSLNNISSSNSNNNETTYCSSNDNAQQQHNNSSSNNDSNHINEVSTEITNEQPSNAPSITDQGGSSSSNSSVRAPSEPPSIVYAKQRRYLLSKIAQHKRETARFAGDKLSLATALYESIDQAVRRVDTDLRIYEDQLVLGLRPGTRAGNDAPSLQSPSAPSSPVNKDTDDKDVIQGDRLEFLKKQADEAASRERKARSIKGGDPSSPGTASSPNRIFSRSPTRSPRRLTGFQLDDLEIDPNEPTYCYCNRVSFGEMIGCDNDDCPKEWFHLECLGMKEAPKGKWYCNECAEALGISRNKKRR